jgi:hypothetical protein
MTALTYGSSLACVTGGLDVAPHNTRDFVRGQWNKALASLT